MCVGHSNVIFWSVNGYSLCVHITCVVWGILPVWCGAYYLCGVGHITCVVWGI